MIRTSQMYKIVTFVQGKPSKKGETLENVQRGGGGQSLIQPLNGLKKTQNGLKNKINNRNIFGGGGRSQVGLNFSPSLTIF